MINLVGQEDPKLIIASLIKQQEQLNESQPMETDGDSQDVDSHAPVTMNGISSFQDAYGTTDDLLYQRNDIRTLGGGRRSPG
jgi:hypothetical protein